MSSDPIAFSTEQQAAVLGHALGDPEIWPVLDGLGLDKSWFLDDRLKVFWDYCSDFRTRNARPPTSGAEIVSHVLNHYDAGIREATERKVALCQDSAASHAWDVLHLRVVMWARFEAAKRLALEIQRRHDAGEHDGIEQVILDSATEIQLLEVAGGVGRDHFELSYKRARGEREERLKSWETKLSWGVPVLDDFTEGIFRHDLALISAKSGGGKTALGTIIARANARKGKKVRLFALEASPREVERRIKFNWLIKRWRQDHPQQIVLGAPRWRDWFRGNPIADVPLRAYEGEWEAWYQETHPRLVTYYKGISRFRPEDLQREILAEQDADLVVLDHFGYVDSGDLNENAEANKLITVLRNLTISTGIPIIVVVHINKAGEQVLSPDQFHVHGSSDVYKKATTVITLAPAREIVFAEDVKGCSPTFIRMAKERVDPSWHVSVALYDNAAGEYRDRYAVGTVNYANTKWGPIVGDKIPEWVRRERFIETATSV